MSRSIKLKWIIKALLLFLGLPSLVSQEICLKIGAGNNRYESYSLKGDKMIFESDRNEKHLKQLTHNNNGDTLPNWSPNDKKILFTAYRNVRFNLHETHLK